MVSIVGKKENRFFFKFKYETMKFHSPQKTVSNEVNCMKKTTSNTAITTQQQQ
jgi:hypothetical protein